MSESAAGLVAGAATVDVTPPGSVFLFGYPHVPRMSTGVHDPLACAALYVRAGVEQALFLATDVIWVPKALASDIRRRIGELTGISDEAIMLTATHTHSGPVMSDCLSNAADPIVPSADAAWLRRFADGVVAAAEAAVSSAVPAEIGLAVACAADIGGNRSDPGGPADPEIPVLLVREPGGGSPIGCMLVCAMHPTVLHENSTLISGDFPHFTRRCLQTTALRAECPVLFHQGASGNQSPRHVTRANTFAEAQRLGELLGRAVASAIKDLRFRRGCSIICRRTAVDLEPRRFPSVDDAACALAAARNRLEHLKRGVAPRPDVRTAECDVFGAEETVELARAAVDGRLAAAAASCNPAEVQLIEVGRWKFVGWPGEFFAEYALEVKAAISDTFVVTLANGELQGYIVTPEAAERGVYEAGNAIFAADNGRRVVEATLALLRGTKPASAGFRRK